MSFIEQVFGADVPNDESILIARQNDNGGWQQRRPPQDLAELIGSPWYYCIATVTAQKPLRRTKADVRAVYVLVLDDVGTKCDEPPVTPSYMMETSPGNFQYGYLLQPAAPSLYEACIDALAEAGLTDPGARGANRVVRLPGSLNLKNGHLSKFMPLDMVRAWDLSDLMDAFGVEPHEERPAPAGGAVPDGVYLIDEVVEWLREEGHVRQEKANGWLELVECPWAAAHTTPGGDTGYSPLGAGGAEYAGTRGFKCQHGHCAERSVSDFLDWVAAQGGPAEVSSAAVQVADALGELRRGVVDRAKLPDVIWRAADGPPKPTAVQLATKPNIEYVCKALGATPRFNLMEQELSLGNGYTLDDLHDECQRVGIKSFTDVNQKAVAIAERYHPMCDWVRSAEWDGTSRFEDLCASVSVAQEYEAIWPVYLRKWLIQTVEAVCGWRKGGWRSKPHVLVLSGGQGVGKTHWLVHLAPREFTVDGAALHLASYANKDSMLSALSGAITELGELETTFGKSDQGALKNFLSQGKDKIRRPYAREALTLPRCTSFCATVNTLSFLQDETGSRRFWPVVVEHIERHDIDMQQVWAEVHTWWAAGEGYGLSAEHEKVREEQSSLFTAVDPMDLAIEDLIELIQRVPTLQWNAVNASNLAKALGIWPLDKGQLNKFAARVDRILGSRRAKIDGIQKAWRAPVGKIPPLH